MEIVLLAVEGFNQRPGCFDQENRVSALSPWRLCLDHGALGNYAEWGLGWIRNDKRPFQLLRLRLTRCRFSRIAPSGRAAVLQYEPCAPVFEIQPRNEGIDMPWIKTIEPEDATGGLKLEYDKAMKRAGKVFNILKVQSLNPESLRASMHLYLATMFGPSGLSRAEREMLATVVSQANHCFY